jgi:hypothetical protein
MRDLLPVKSDEFPWELIRFYGPRKNIFTFPRTTETSPHEICYGCENLIFVVAKHLNGNHL